MTDTAPDYSELDNEGEVAEATEPTLTMSQVQELVSDMNIDISIRRDALAFALQSYGPSTGNEVSEFIVERAAAFEKFLLGGEENNGATD